MRAALLWMSLVVGCGLLVKRSLQNAGLFLLAGSVLALLWSYTIATVPEVFYLAVILWFAAALLLLSRFVDHRRRRIA